MKFQVTINENEEWPVTVEYDDVWLSANSYWLRDQLVGWLIEQKMDYSHEQRFKTFKYMFKNTRDSTLFVMRWS